MENYPLLIKPCPREIIWGGTKLKEKYNKEAPFEKIAESWEISIRDGALSLIDNGAYKGMALNDYLVSTDDPFSLLIKYIDAEDTLSVQVHPGDSVKDENGLSIGKTEMWYIVEADENAELVYGLKKDISIEDFKKAVESDKTEECLNYIKVKTGEAYFIPSGLVHAICKGILIAEIQQNSDTTYRIYDYNRTDKSGNKRELHIADAMKVIKNYTADEISAIQFSKNDSADTLACCDKFTVKRLETENEAVIDNADRSYAIMCIEGAGYYINNSVEYPVNAGETYFIPKNCGKIICRGKLNLIISKE